jgi:3-oxoacyl-(acyl-carrier-protein) synthase
MTVAKRRVVITGMDTINPLGDTLDDYYDNLINGKSGIKKWESLDVSNIDCKIGGDLGHYNFSEALEKLRSKVPEELHRKLRKLFRTMTFSNKATTLTAICAYHHAGLFNVNVDPYRISVLAAGHNFNSNYVLDNMHQFEEEPAYVDPLFGVEALDPNIPATITEVLLAQGPTFTVGGACASGNIALRDGFRDIINGECDISVVSGAIFDMAPCDIHAMAVLNSLVIDPEYLDKPEAASRPFDINRKGFIPSHGAGTLILENLEFAKDRGAMIYAEVLGVAANANANHLPIPSGDVQAHLIKTLLNITGVQPEEVDYVNCHATGTPVGDINEINAIKKAFGKHAYKLKLNAPKSMLGHVCWSAPIVESIGGILQMQRGKLHPSINIEKLDPEIDLDTCKDGPVKHSISIMLKNSFGFGGLNSCALIKRFEE